MFSICSIFLAVSLHMGLGDGWNDVHPGARCEVGQWTAGAYYNSERTISPYASYTFEHESLFLDLGIVGGYSGADVLPFFRAGVDLERAGKLFVMPGFVEEQDGTLRIGAVMGYEITF